MHVRVEPEDGGTFGRVVRPHALEDARAVMEAVRGDMHLGGIPRYELSVHPDEIRFSEGGHCSIGNGNENGKWAARGSRRQGVDIFERCSSPADRDIARFHGLRWRHPLDSGRITLRLETD